MVVNMTYDQELAAVTAALLVLALVGFLLSFWDMGVVCLIVGAITGVAWAKLPTNKERNR